MFQDIDAVIFDLDGTLVDSMWIWKKIDIEYLGRFGIAYQEDLQPSIEGMSFSETAHYFKERFAIPDSIEKIKSDWNEMTREKYKNEVPLKPGALAFMKRCRERGLLLGIATSNSRELVEEVADSLSFRPYFDVVKTACEVEKGKPARDIYLAVARELGVEPSRCMVFEDIVPGIMAGRQAGMQVCAVEDDYSLQKKQEKEALADYYIHDYHDILGLV